MLLRVEVVRVEPPAEEPCLGKEQSHSFSDDVTDDGQEDNGHGDALRLEEEDGRQG